MNAVRFRSALALAAACAAAWSTLALGPQRPAAEARRSAATPSPAASSAISPAPAAQTSDQPVSSPSPVDASPVPSPSDSPQGRRKRARSSSPSSPAPSPTPTSPAFSSLDGYWEVVLQTPSDNFYSRFDLHQSADAITGVWTRDAKKLPMEGTFGGRQFKFVAKDDAGRTLTLTGYIENASDMVGMVDDGSGKTPTAFTAEHRTLYHSRNLLPRRGEGRGT